MSAANSKWVYQLATSCIRTPFLPSINNRTPRLQFRALFGAWETSGYGYNWSCHQLGGRDCASPGDSYDLWLRLWILLRSFIVIETRSERRALFFLPISPFLASIERKSYDREYLCSSHKLLKELNSRECTTISVICLVSLFRKLLPQKFNENG